MMFPWRILSDEKLQEEFNALTQVRFKTKLTNNRKGHNASNHFFQYERMATKAPNSTIPTKWLLTHREAFEKHQKPTHDDFGKWIYMTKCCAQFNPGVAVQLYDRYQATHVFDPFAGWGDRCLGAMAYGIHYTGCDTNENLQQPYEQMIDFFPSTHRPTIHCPANAKDIAIPQEVDLVFTSPPFYKNNRLFEKYHGASEDYQVFLTEVLFPLREKTSARIALHIPPNMYEDIKKQWGDADEIHSFAIKDRIYVWNPRM